MPNHSAVAIANEFLRRRSDDGWPQQMLIQKLAYIANGWNLAINGEPLIRELPQAWDNGPVYRSIWDHIKNWGYRGPACTLTDPATGTVVEEPLTASEREIIDHVWRRYGNLSAVRLSEMTHEPNTPWYKAYFGRGRNALLQPDEIKAHYTELALAGRGSA